MSKDLLEDLNLNQKEAVLHKNGPALVFAGAGSGKTRTLTYRAAYLIQKQNVDPSQILLVTFTNKAAHEIKSRIQKLLKNSRKDEIPLANTFHSWCARILRVEAHNAKIKPNFLIYDEKDQLATIKKAFEKLSVSLKTTSPKAVLNAISSAKNELISHLEYPQYAKGYFQETVSNVYLTYQKLLKEFNALDFDDLLLKTVNLLQNNDQVLDKYTHQYQHVLVDEYQDTNQAQYNLSKMLSRKWRNLFVVGDCSQSIYSWRGADFRNVLKLQNDFPNLKIYHLEQNYRSKENILKAAFSVINKNTTHPILKLWTDQNGGEKISLFSSQNEKKEAQFIVHKILRNIAYNKESKLNDFAVLYRTNAQSRNLEEAFLRSGIPYQLIGGTRFYNRKEIKDSLSYLRLIANPKDVISKERVNKIGKRRAKKFFDWLKKAKLKNKKTVNILDKVLKITDYLSKFNPKNPQDLARLENIKELRSVAVEFNKLDSFLENVSLVEQEHMPDKKTKKLKNSDAVYLMTLHASKGLEFKTVFMVGMEEGLFPHSRALLNKHELEEERRLCYVGITRTKEKLYFTFCSSRLYFGTKMYNTVSRFIGDLPQKLLTLE